MTDPTSEDHLVELLKLRAAVAALARRYERIAAMPAENQRDEAAKYVLAGVPADLWAILGGRPTDQADGAQVVDLDAARERLNHPGRDE